MTPLPLLQGAHSTPHAFQVDERHPYVHGFGSLGGEFWWGLYHLWWLTAQPDRIYELRIDLVTSRGREYRATYQNFAVGSVRLSGNHFARLQVGNYSGDAGDELANDVAFSTEEVDVDRHPKYHCAEIRNGGWWYNACGASVLNGPRGDTDPCMIWGELKCLSGSTMKIRPTEK